MYYLPRFDHFSSFPALSVPTLQQYVNNFHMNSYNVTLSRLYLLDSS